MTSYCEYGNERIHWTKSSHKTFCIQPLMPEFGPHNIQKKISMSGPFAFRYKTDIFNMHLSQARYSLTSSSCVSAIPHKLTFYCVRWFIHCDMSSGNSGVDIHRVEDLAMTSGWHMLVSLSEGILSLKSLILLSSLLFDIWMFLVELGYMLDKVKLLSQIYQILFFFLTFDLWLLSF